MWPYSPSFDPEQQTLLAKASRSIFTPVGSEDAHALQLEQDALVHAPRVPVAVAPQDDHGDLRKRPPDALRIPDAVAEEHDLIGAVRFHGPAHGLGAAVGIGKNGEEHVVSQPFAAW